MNDRFKFRAWDSNTNQMLYMNQQYGLSPQYQINDDSWTRFWESLARCSERFDLMQYTGLKDSNDREIYEGDIILLPKFEWDDPVPGGYYKKNTDIYFTLVWDTAQWGYRIDIINRPKGLWGTSMTVVFNLTGGYKHMGYSDSIKVVGNIYENPELLKQNT